MELASSVKVGPGPPKPVVVESMSSEEVEDASSVNVGPGPPKPVVVGSSQSLVGMVSVVAISDVVSVSVKGGKVPWFLEVVPTSQVQDSVTVGMVNVPWKRVVSSSVKVVTSVMVSVTVITSQEAEVMVVAMSVSVNVSTVVDVPTSVEVSVNGGPVTPNPDDVGQGGA